MHGGALTAIKNFGYICVAFIELYPNSQVLPAVPLICPHNSYVLPLTFDSPADTEPADLTSGSFSAKAEPQKQNRQVAINSNEINLFFISIPSFRIIC